MPNNTEKTDPFFTHPPEERWTCYEHPAGHELGPNDSGGMAEWIAEAEAMGFEGEFVFDASVEEPPHPFWDPVAGCCHTDAESEADD